MSTYVMAACWPIQIPPTPKAVLISLADNANDHGFCWPSIATISARTCFGKTAVIEAIRWLEEHGLVVADRENGRHTKYQIKPNAMTPELFDTVGNRTGKQTGPRAEPVGQTNRSASRTGPADEPDRSASRTQPVREADTNRQEPTRTKEREQRAPSGTRLPPDWGPSAEDRKFAATERPEVNVDAEAAKFRDYWHGLASPKGRKADWSATWRNWVRRADAPKGVSTPPTGSAPAAPPTDWRKPSETPLQRALAHIRHQHHCGAYGEGPEADAERDRLIADAERRHGPPSQAVGT